MFLSFNFSIYAVFVNRLQWAEISADIEKGDVILHNFIIFMSL